MILSTTIIDGGQVRSSGWLRSVRPGFTCGAAHNVSVDGVSDHDLSVINDIVTFACLG